MTDDDDDNSSILESIRPKAFLGAMGIQISPRPCSFQFDVSLRARGVTTLREEPKVSRRSSPTWEFSRCESQAAVVVILTAISGIMSLYEIQRQLHSKNWCARSIWPSHDRPAPTKVIASAHATASDSCACTVCPA